MIKHFIILQQIQLSPRKWTIFGGGEEAGDFSDFSGCKNALRVKGDRSKNENCFFPFGALSFLPVDFLWGIS